MRYARKHSYAEDSDHPKHYLLTILWLFRDGRLGVLRGRANPIHWWFLLPLFHPCRNHRPSLGYSAWSESPFISTDAIKYIHDKRVYRNLDAITYTSVYNGISFRGVFIKSLFRAFSQQIFKPLNIILAEEGISDYADALISEDAE